MKRSSLIVRRLLAAGLVGTLAACSGGGGSHSSPVTPGAPTGGAPSISSHLVSTMALPSLMSSATKTGDATDIAGAVIHVVVNLRNGQGLADYARGVSDPNDGRYRNYLTASQIGDTYGASKDDYAAVASYFQSYGLRVGGYPQRLALTVAGPRAALENAIGTRLSYYRSPEGTTVVAPAGDLHFAKGLPISSIAHVIFDPSAKHADYVRGAATGPNVSGFAPQQVATAFDYTSAYNDGFTGAGINVGIIGTGPYMQNDFTAYKKAFGLNGAANVRVVVGTTQAAANTGDISPTASPPPVTAPCNQSSYPGLNPSESPTATCNPEDGETQIDTQQASLARDANILYYLTYVPVDCNSGTVQPPCAKNVNTGAGYAFQGLAESDDEIQQAIADNDGRAGNGADILSLSFGGPEELNTFETRNNLNGYDPTTLQTSEFAALAAEGVAVFASSGDQGANICARYTLSMDNTPCVSYPSGDQNVSSVGGVTVGLDGAGNLLGPITAWGRQTASGGAAGGGVSKIVPVPLWQFGPNIVASGRNQPDLSLLADPATSVATYENVAFGAAGGVSGFGGTSVSTPQMAAMWALVLHACARTPSCARAGGSHPYRLGNAAPYFYQIYNDPARYPATFVDVTFGNIGLAGCEVRGSCAPGSVSPPPAAQYRAGQYYDNATGIGVPFARHLIKSVVGV